VFENKVDGQTTAKQVQAGDKVGDMFLHRGG
jgi:hypothetical protein